jgi:Flp pilus assembly protein CpaB
VGSRKIIMLVGSILIGALAGFALLNYVQGVEQDVRQEVVRVPVFVISSDVPAGTTASDVQQTNRIQQREVESAFRPANAITDLSQIQGRISVSSLAANQILVDGMFEDPEVIETTYADLIADDHVAFSITIDKAKAVNGFIEPGDFVDMIVLGDPPATPGEEDAFETSAASSPYDRPARYLYRGVRIVSIGQEIAGQSRSAVEGEDAPVPEEETGDLNITLAVPPGAAQRILSVSEGDIVLSLLPSDWSPAAQTNEVLEEILIASDLPGEDPTLITPYGQEGFVDDLAEKLADVAGFGVSAASDKTAATDTQGEIDDGATDGDS